MYALPLVASQVIFQLGMASCQGRQMPRERAIGIAGNAGLTLIISWATLTIAANAFIVILASSVAYIVAGLSMVGAAWADEKSEHSVATTIQRPPLNRAVLIRNARAMYGTNVVVQLISNADVNIAALLLPPSAVGQYQIARKLAQGVTMPMISILPVMFGRIANLCQAQRSNIAAKLAIGFTLFIVSLALFGHYAVGQVVRMLFGESFIVIVPICMMLISAFFMQFLKDLMATIANAGRQDILAFFVNCAVGLVAVGTGLTFLALSPGLVTLSSYGLVPLVYYFCGVVMFVVWLPRRGVWSARMSLLILTCAVLAMSSAAIGVV
jgi:O-antigen/teichoic acid export membrane protein